MAAAFLIVLFQASAPLAVVTDAIRPQQDILGYDVAIVVADDARSIAASARVTYVTNAETGPLVLDFDRTLDIDSVLVGNRVGSEGTDWNWRKSEGTDLLDVFFWGASGDTLAITVFYSGRPQDGLILRDNIHGDRTAFADNWPNRARHWFPSEDHPSDKATVSFSVEVPQEWSVVANGVLSGVDTLSSGRTAWRWVEERPIPVHTMVIGAGVLTVANIGEVDGATQSVWTFPSDSAFAVDVPFNRATEMVAALSALIGPFPFGKLAHVQSSTRYGGMENSSAIFYNERGYATRRMGDGVVAHEIAHQWFGDAVAQSDWHHLWLSEGFATYFGDLTFQLLGENDRFREEMESSKRRYMGSGVVDRPVIDTTEHNLFSLLNANNYQKGAWVLHMLRAELGDSVFFRAVQEYYATYRDSTALSSDFAAIVSRTAEKPMQWFFEQWLLQPGYPQIEATWSQAPGSDEILLTIHQVQERRWGDFSFRLPVRVHVADGSTELLIVDVHGREWSGTLSGVRAVDLLEVDPGGTLLLEVKSVQLVN